MNPKFAPLFQAFTLNNGVRIMNRLAVAPMTHFASHPDGSISEEERVFLRARADHVGLFITAATLVASDGKAFIGQPEAVGEKDLLSLREVAGIIQARGAKAILQIHHGGKLSIHGLLNGGEIVAPSADLELAARALDDAQIETLIHSFANAADLAIRAGFDGVEIHGANGYLLQQFYSSQSNRRRDCWGGDRERRLKFPLAVVDAVLSTRERRQRTDFIVGYRFSPEEPGENGLTMDDTFVLLDALVQRPLQYLHVSLWDFHKRARRGANPRLTRMQLIHERIGGKLPLVGVGNLLGADEMLAALLTGWAEFIALGKAILMNPDVSTLIARGRESEIVKVIDPAKRDRYGIPGRLWEQNMRRLSYLPQVKD